jgi:hypothetical protein
MARTHTPVLPDFLSYNIPKQKKYTNRQKLYQKATQYTETEKIYQTPTNYTKRPYNIPKQEKIY